VKEKSPKAVGKGSVDSLSLFKFTKGEIEAENIIRIV